MATIQLYVGVVTEGDTDIRFLNRVLESIFLDIAYNCENEVIIESIIFFSSDGNTFVEKMLNASMIGVNKYGISILCIHVDQDGQDVYANKITPFLNALREQDRESHCQIIVPIIPIRMIEAWMLADKELLKERIYGQQYRDVDLGLHRPPESYADPKCTIENAIRKVMEEHPKKRRDQVTIADLYSEIGNSIAIEKLRALPSFVDFERNVRKAFVDLHYIVE